MRKKLWNGINLFNYDLTTTTTNNYSILYCGSTGFDDNFASLWHRFDWLLQAFFCYGLPCCLHCFEKFELSFRFASQVFDWIKDRRFRRPAHNIDAVVFEPFCDDIGLVLGIVILLKNLKKTDNEKQYRHFLNYYHVLFRMRTF